MTTKESPEILSTRATHTSQTNAGFPTPLQRVSSEKLLTGKKELVIEHCGEEYRLRITSKGKLILTK